MTKNEAISYWVFMAFVLFCVVFVVMNMEPKDQQKEDQGSVKIETPKQVWA